jgi:hypothetical protein
MTASAQSALADSTLINTAASKILRFHALGCGRTIALCSKGETLMLKLKSFMLLAACTAFLMTVSSSANAQGANGTIYICV